MSPERFPDRRAAGCALVPAVRDVVGDDHEVLVLALPRGGVPVAFEVARGLHAALDVFVVRKLGVPGHEELAMGAIASGGIVVRNDEVLGAVGVTDDAVRGAIDRERVELERRDAAYRGDRPRPRLAGRTVVLVDDGLATGSTMRAAVLAVRDAAPARIVVAVPVGAASTCDALRTIADEVVCALVPRDFAAVGQWYEDFTQTTDDEVRELLDVAGVTDS